MSYLAITGFALCGIASFLAFLFAVRCQGLRANVAESECDRERLEQELRDASREAIDREKRLMTQVKDLKEDVKVARAELNDLYGRVPGLAPERLDSAIDRARRILAGARGRPPGVPGGAP